MNKRILIVDDEPNLLLTMADILNTVGYEVITADNGSMAVEKVREQNFDAVLLDYKMTGLSGVETFRMMQKIHPTVKVIFITAYYHKESIQNAIQEGALGVCSKPVQMPQLLDYLKAATGSS